MRVAFLDGPLFEHRLPFLKAMQDRVDKLRVFVTDLGFDPPESESRVSGGAAT